MWDKTTGRLEGIWEGDESVVNGGSILIIQPHFGIHLSYRSYNPAVVEQHPSLPIFAVSGIDSTVKVIRIEHPAWLQRLTISTIFTTLTGLRASSRVYRPEQREVTSCRRDY
jgi:hypothetical protein